MQNEHVSRLFRRGYCLEKALRSEELNELTACFDKDSHWRDLLAFTGRFHHSAADEISNGLARFKK